MDGSFLSQTDVIAASRKFVCIRLATYESAEEALILKSFFIGRSGELENTTFAIVAPDGKTKLTRAGRSPDHIFQGRGALTPAAEMAQTMDEIAARYDGAAQKDVAALPAAEDVRLGLDIASCDGQPLVIVCGDDEAARTKLAERVAAAAWSPAFVGRAAFAIATKDTDLKPVSGAAKKPGVLVVQPDPYGLTGKVLAQTPADADAAKIAKALAEGFAAHKAAAKDPRTHIEQGRRLGVDWETEIPDTDPGPQGGGPGGPGGPPGRR